MKNLTLGFLLLASAELCTAHGCLAQERPKRAGTGNRVIAALTWPVRTYFAADLANRVASKVAGVPLGSHPEYVLEGIVVAKQGRA